jgi:hypothetical protein
MGWEYVDWINLQTTRFIMSFEQGKIKLLNKWHVVKNKTLYGIT